MVWVCLDDARHVAVDAKDVGTVFRYEAKQRSVGGYVRTCDWRFDFRRRDEFERQRPLSLLERKAENLRARLIEHLGNDVALVFPDEQAFAIEGRPGKFKLPRAFRGNGPGSRLRIRLVDFINGQRVSLCIVVTDVANEQVSRVVDGEVFPIVQRHADNGEGRAGVALAVDRVKDLFLWPAAVVVRPEHTVPAAGADGGAFLDSR